MPREPVERGACLVLVEDDDVDAMAVRRGLRKLGCRHPIERFCDGEQALDYLLGARASGSAAPVLLIDINMPRMNGIELLEELRRERAFDAVQIFVLSTSAHAQDIQAAARLGVSGYFTKSEARSAYNRVFQALQRASTPTSLA